MRKRQSVDRLKVFVETTIRHAELFPQIVLYGIPSQNLRETDGVMKHLTDACESGFVWGKPGYMCNWKRNHFIFVWNDILQLGFYWNDMNWYI